MKKMTEEECLAIGGHCWNRHSANDVVDEFGKPEVIGGATYRTALHYPNGEPQYRTCRHCGKKERKLDDWVSV